MDDLFLHPKPVHLLKTLISEQTILDAFREGKTTLNVLPGTLITSLARDTARQRGIELVLTQPTPSSPAPEQVSSATRRIAIGSDHGGFAYKAELKTYLDTLGWQTVDVGTDVEKSCDYPDFAYAVARLVQLGKVDLGIMIDGAGIGSAMVANKVPGIRAACAYNSFTAWNARAHNNTNVLTLGSRTLGIEVCKRIVHTFLDTSFEGGRHQKRVAKITDVEARFSRS